MALSTTQRGQLQNIYNQEAATLQAKYGPSLIVEHLRFVTQDGVITGLVATINIETPPDVDGDTTRQRKEVDLW